MAQGENAYAVQPYEYSRDSGHPYQMVQNSYFTPDHDEEDALLTSDAFAFRDDDVWPSQKMTAMVPPSYDGTTSFFAHKEHVEELLLITTVDEDKQGPCASG